MRKMIAQEFLGHHTPLPAGLLETCGSRDRPEQGGCRSCSDNRSGANDARVGRHAKPWIGGLKTIRHYEPFRLLCCRAA